MVKAWILILTTPGSEVDLVQKVSQIPQVKEVAVVYGEWDVIIKVEVDTLKDLDEVTLKIRKEIPGIVKTTTLIAV